jgi:ketosteroid isomerase-like protein
MRPPAVLPLSMLAATLFAPAPARGQGENDSAAVVAVVTAFHAALAAGDSAAALRLLADDVLVLESGGIETLAEYRSHHLPADIRFAQSVPSARQPVRVVVSGDVAWAAATSRTSGTYQGRTINATGVELMVLARRGGAWRIQAIHWSSRRGAS